MVAEGWPVVGQGLGHVLKVHPEAAHVGIGAGREENVVKDLFQHIRMPLIYIRA